MKLLKDLWEMYGGLGHWTSEVGEFVGVRALLFVASDNLRSWEVVQAGDVLQSSVPRGGTTETSETDLTVTR